MKYWIMPISTDFVNLDTRQGEDVFVVWRTHTKFNVGDIAYFYIKAPEKRIGYRLQVNQTGLPNKEFLSGERGYINNDYYYWRNDKESTFVEFRLLDKFPNTPSFSYSTLSKHGLKGFVRRNQGIQESLRQYLEDLISLDAVTFDADPEFLRDTEQYSEGTALQVQVNRYERNRMAREQCIAMKGCRCAVCGMDFGKVYGEIGKSFIHVHHIVPIASIGKNYVIDPENDLVPVCPNCHAMLHRHDPPYTVAELKGKMSQASSIYTK